MNTTDRLTNLPSILRGIASDEEIRSSDDLRAINDAATEIEVCRRKTAQWIDEFTEKQGVIQAWKDRCADLEAERAQLVRWQAEAVEVLKAWDQVADLVPGSFLVLAARRSACVHAYIDHLQVENRALVRANHSLIGDGLVDD